MALHCMAGARIGAVIELPNPIYNKQISVLDIEWLNHFM